MWRITETVAHTAGHTEHRPLQGAEQAGVSAYTGDQPLSVLLPCHRRVPLLGEESAELSSLTMKGELIFSKPTWLTMPKVREIFPARPCNFSIMLFGFIG